MHSEETPKLPFHENCFWLFIHHVWFPQGLTGIGCMMLGCKNQLPPLSCFGKEWPGWGAWWKVVKTKFPPLRPFATNELLMIHGTSGNKQMADQNEMFLSLVYICLQGKKQTNKQIKQKQTNKQTSLNRLRLLMTASIVKGITFAVVNRSVHANATISMVVDERSLGLP